MQILKCVGRRQERGTKRKESCNYLGKPLWRSLHYSPKIIPKNRVNFIEAHEIMCKYTKSSMISNFID